MRQLSAMEKDILDLKDQRKEIMKRIRLARIRVTLIDEDRIRQINAKIKELEKLLNGG